MLKPDASSVYVLNHDIANVDGFFNGTFNTFTLEADPLINGFAFIKWTHVPKWVEDAYPSFVAMSERNFKEFGGISDIELESDAMTHGFNANEYSYAKSIKKNNTEFTIKHQEFSGSPMRHMYSYWITGIRDPETGFASYPRLAKCDYGAKNHTGELMYIATRPDVNNVDFTNIEFACYYSAVFPTRILLGQFNFTAGNNDGFEYEQTFKGNFHYSSKIDAYAKEILRDKTYGIIEMGQVDPKNPRQQFDGLINSVNNDSTPDNVGRGSEFHVLGNNVATE